jgi:hypothetical protein
MNLQKMIGELQAEKARLDDAILALERLASSNRRRRGRPPRWLKGYQHESTEEAAPSPAEEEDSESTSG